MAQTGYTPISIYYSATTTNVPTAGNLVAGELAINTADGKLFYKDSSGVVQVIGTKGGVGSSTTTQVLYNSSGLVVGSANMTFNGTTLTLANDASISGLTVGKGGSAVATNTALGVSALASNTSGSLNIAIGYQAGQNATTGAAMTAIGYQAGQANTEAVLGTTFVGYQAGNANTSGANTAVGSLALKTNTSGSNNVAIGGQAMQGNTTGGSNVSVGNNSLIVNTTGGNNTAIGQAALAANTTASNNTAVGYQAGYSNTTGVNNVSHGGQSLYSTTTGNNNAALGYQAGYSNTTNSQSTYVGAFAGFSATGSNTVFVGQSAGYNTTGGSNTFIGQNSGSSITSGANHTIIGSYNGNQNGLDIRTNTTGFVVLSTGSGAVMAYSANGGAWYQQNNSATWSITSDRRIKENIIDLNTGLSVISALRPVEFNYIQSKKSDIGFIAQEYQNILPSQVNIQTGIDDATKELIGDDQLLSIQQNLVPYLVKAIQELNAKITALENK